MSESSEYDVIVAGAGASGLIAAGTCAALGLRVLVLEQMNKPGLKLLVTGGGSCNLTHACPPDRIMAAFGRQGRFMAPALARLDPEGLRCLFRSRGVYTVVREDGCVFPSSGSSASVLEALLGRLDPRQVTLLTATRVTRLLADQGHVRGIRTRNETYEARAVILATGGRSYPGLGGSGSGYDLAAFAGHTVRPPVPALVPLVTRETWPGSLAGIAVPDVEIRVAHKSARKESARGELLFTHDGLSGPAVLDISGAVSDILREEQSVEVELNFSPNEDRAVWSGRFEGWRRSCGGSRIAGLLKDYLPRGLALQVCALAGEDPESLSAGRLRRDQVETLIQGLTGLRLAVTGTAGFDKAMTTRGGVSLKEVDPATLQSKVLQGLYLTGEVLDLDGPCGGYNLQWAFSSGMLAGESCAGALKGSGPE
jgi:predicted Rossmann fold flavoprotein